MLVAILLDSPGKLISSPFKAVMGKRMHTIFEGVQKIFTACPKMRTVNSLYKKTHGNLEQMVPFI